MTILTIGLGAIVIFSAGFVVGMIRERKGLNKDMDKK